MAKFEINPKLQLSLWIVALISVALFFLGKKIPPEAIQKILEATGPWAPIVYILIAPISYIFPPISGYPILIVGYYLFGKNAIFYLYAGGMIGYVVNFLIARRWGRPIVAKVAGKEALVKIDEFAKEYGIVALIFLRMFAGNVGDYVSYAYGLTKIKFLRYLLISALAPIPTMTLWYFAASKTRNLEQFIGISTLIGIITALVFFGGNHIIRKHKKLRAKN